jgi:hypothetical protein
MRKLPTPVVANKLGVSNNTVRNMAEKGLLTDLGVTKEGKTKHEYKFDSKEVKEFLATHVRDGRNWVKKAPKEAKPTKPAVSRVKRVPVQDEVQPSIRSGSSGDGPAGFSTRLANIEKTLNRLAKIWE